MTSQIEAYDILLGAALIGAAWKALFGREAFSATIFFVVYGMLMAMAWVQLGAIDVALAEASIGAGLTGALLIGAIRQFEPDDEVHSPTGKTQAMAVAGVLASAVLLGLLTSIFHTADSRSPVPSLVEGNLANAGSSHPVTAVLLNFRGFDTWLELGVLLLASVAAISIHLIYDPKEIPARIPSVQEQPGIVARTMFPILILVGGVLLWFGSWAPGGAFQAGSLIGASGILLQIGGERSMLRLSAFGLRVVLALGFSTFLVIAILTALTGGRILEFPPALAGSLILVLELAATLSIALTLNVIYACSHPWGAK
jgi:multisubunit Na+/H+ antiporter MnhB subunit